MFTSISCLGQDVCVTAPRIVMLRRCEVWESVVFMSINCVEMVFAVCVE